MLLKYCVVLQVYLANNYFFSKPQNTTNLLNNIVIIVVIVSTLVKINLLLTMCFLNFDNLIIEFKKYNKKII